MNCEDLTGWLRQHLDVLRRYGVVSIAVFGSVARGEATERSDVDLLVEFEGRVSFDCYMELKFYLEDGLGRSVDLVSAKMLKPQLQKVVRREAVYVS